MQHTSDAIRAAPFVSPLCPPRQTEGNARERRQDVATAVYIEPLRSVRVRLLQYDKNLT
jgi:hypothetical protein